MDLGFAYNLASKLAKKAGKMLISKKKSINVLMKVDQRDIVTDLDMDSQQMIVKAIRTKYPGHNILSEEAVPLSMNSPYTWIIDPVDGTKHLMGDIPLYTVSIALKHKEEIVVGAVYDPNSGNLFSAQKGRGAFLNGKEIHVSRKEKLNESIIYIDAAWSHKLNKTEYMNSLRIFSMIFRNAYKVRMLGVGSLGMCYMAMGGFEGFVDITGKTKPWDIAAGRIIALEAGARIDYVGQSIVVTNGRITADLVSLLKS